MMVGARPTDEQILTVMRRWRQTNSTYVIRNILAQPEFGGFNDLNTSAVLYQLKKLERDGKVRRVAASYYSGVHAEWEIVE